jgi:cysteine synthase
MVTPTTRQPLLARPTPLLRVRAALLKLEALRPSAGFDDRALPLWDALPGGELAAGADAVFAGSAGAALAAASWAWARGVKLTAIVHGALLHEARETLRIWRVPWEPAPSREAALALAARRADQGARLLPPLDGPEAAGIFERTLGAELLRDLEEAQLSPALVVAPAGAAAALAGAVRALRPRFPSVQPLLLMPRASGDELPELPAAASAPPIDIPGVRRQAVTRAEAAQARAELALELGLLAGHAGALAAQIARRTAVPAGSCAIALVGSAGEREFSLDAADAPAQVAP